MGDALAHLECSGGDRPHDADAAQAGSGGPAPFPAGAAAPDDRWFGLRAPSPDPTLESLLNLARWLADDIDTAVALSAITGPALRDRFPAGRREIGTIACRSGLDLQADMSDIFAASAAFGRLQEAEDFETVMALVDPGSTVVDVGANFGLYAAHAALYAGATGAVFAFEPMPEAYELLEANTKGAGLNCTCVRAAVGAANAVSTFRIAADSSFSGLKDTGRSTTVGSIDVEVMALDAFAPLAQLSPDLIKIDVEGGEQAVLAGARGLLARSPDVLVMFEFSYKNLDSQSRAELIEELDELGRMGLGLYCRTADGQGAQRIEPAELQGDRSENLFLVRPESPAAARLQAAMRRRIPPLTTEQQATIAVLKRFDRQWRAADHLARTIAEAAAAEFALNLSADPLANFKDYRAASIEAQKQFRLAVAAQERDAERVIQLNAQLAATVEEARQHRRTAIEAEKQLKLAAAAQEREAERVAQLNARLAVAVDEIREHRRASMDAQKRLKAALAAGDREVKKVAQPDPRLAAFQEQARAAREQVKTLKEEIERGRRSHEEMSQSLATFRAALANTHAKYEDASSARDWLLGQMAELKARHGIVDPDFPG